MLGTIMGSIVDRRIERRFSGVARTARPSTSSGRQMLADNLPSLRCQDAVAAIICLDDGRYLLQLRDDKPWIFFPNHWGLFGGALDDHETPLGALQRELKEELDYDLDPTATKNLSDFTFTLGWTDRPPIARGFFEVSMTASALRGLRLREGKEVAAFTAGEALNQLRMTPYDAFALWLHASRHRLS
jgi:8-oxo-dGTP pyrophosphatase MutT (NUDIX family)